MSCDIQQKQLKRPLGFSKKLFFQRIHKILPHIPPWDGPLFLHHFFWHLFYNNHLGNRSCCNNNTTTSIQGYDEDTKRRHHQVIYSPVTTIKRSMPQYHYNNEVVHSWWAVKQPTVVSYIVSSVTFITLIDRRWRWCKIF